jgi:hypothetical protein
MQGEKKEADAHITKERSCPPYISIEASNE